MGSVGLGDGAGAFMSLLPTTITTRQGADERIPISEKTSEAHDAEARKIMSGMCLAPEFPSDDWISNCAAASL